ncbi:MAG: thioredoxin domain-containing protein, partial [Planctomycetota bacterium]
MKDKMPNKLILENSPYLLQHAYNPVNWFAWNDEPFEKAKNEGKLIFLSIGYSTCHWCHVMEKESFEDEEVAKILNENYISIKVDREERPDIDAIYMTVCQAISGSGGWPLTVILTPDKKPIFAGTYFPKKSMFGKPGLIEILNEINNLWNKHKEKLEQNANEITTL